MIVWHGTLRKEGERVTVNQFLSIDQVRGHLTPGLLGNTLRKLSRKGKEQTEGTWRGLTN